MSQYVLSSRVEWESMMRSGNYLMLLMLWRRMTSMRMQTVADISNNGTNKRISRISLMTSAKNKFHCRMWCDTMRLESMGIRIRIPSCYDDVRQATIYNILMISMYVWAEGVHHDITKWKNKDQHTHCYCTKHRCGFFSSTDVICSKGQFQWQQKMTGTYSSDPPLTHTGLPTVMFNKSMSS